MQISRCYRIDFKQGDNTLLNSFYPKCAAATLLLALACTTAGSATTLNPVGLSGHNAVTFTQGQLSVASGSAVLLGYAGQGADSNTTVDFGPLTATGYSVTNNNFDELFTGGTFTIKDTGTSTLLLGGTFGSSDLTGTLGANSGTLNLRSDSVNYNPASTYLPSSQFSPFDGVLSLEFNSANAFATNGSSTGLADFTGTDGITFSAQPGNNVGGHGGGGTPTPEPGTLATLAMGAFGLAALGFKSKKSSSVLS